MSKHHKHHVANVTPIKNGTPRSAAEQNNIPPQLAEALASVSEHKPVTMADVIPEAAVTELAEGMAAWSGQVHAEHEATSPQEQEGPTPAPDTMEKHADPMHPSQHVATQDNGSTVEQEIATTVAAIPPRPRYINLRWQEFTDDCGLRWHAFKHSMHDGYVAIATPTKAFWVGVGAKIKRAHHIVIVHPVAVSRRNVNHFFALRGRKLVFWAPIYAYAGLLHYIAYHFLMKWW